MGPGSAAAVQLLGNLVIPLNVDPCDVLLSDCTTPADGPGEVNEPATNLAISTPLDDNTTVNEVLTSQQKSSFGCGELCGRNCDVVGGGGGIDFENNELSVSGQSWPGVSGSPAEERRRCSLNEPRRPRRSWSS